MLDLQRPLGRLRVERTAKVLIVAGDDLGPPGEMPIFEQHGPGRTTRSVMLEPGTYLIQAAESGEDTTHVWQPGVVEVVSD